MKGTTNRKRKKYLVLALVYVILGTAFAIAMGYLGIKLYDNRNFVFVSLDWRIREILCIVGLGALFLLMIGFAVMANYGGKYLGARWSVRWRQLKKR